MAIVLKRMILQVGVEYQHFQCDSQWSTSCLLTFNQPGKNFSKVGPMEVSWTDSHFGTHYRRRHWVEDLSPPTPWQKGAGRDFDNLEGVPAHVSSGDQEQEALNYLSLLVRKVAGTHLPSHPCAALEGYYSLGLSTLRWREKQRHRLGTRNCVV